MAPQYLVHVYARGGRARTHGDDFIRVHQLEGCHLAKEYLERLKSLDRRLLEERETNLINSIDFEYSMRSCYAFELGFAKVFTKGDWLRPKGNTKWRSKVDFDLIGQWDPSQREPNILESREAEKEVRDELVHEAAMLKARNKLAEHQKTSPLDPLNPQ